MNQLRPDKHSIKEGLEEINRLENIMINSV